MKWFNNLSTFIKLMTGFGVLGMIVALIGWFGLNQLGTLKSNTDAIYKRQQLPLLALSDIQDDLQRIRQDSYKMFTPLSAEESKGVVEQARDMDRSLIERSERFMSQLASDEERASFLRFREAVAR